MKDDQLVTNYGEYYLQIQALSELKSEKNPDYVVEKKVESESFLPIAVGIGLTVVAAALLAELHYKTGQVLKAAMKVALVVVMIPFGLSLVMNPVQWKSQAGPNEIPRNVMVKNVTSSSFEIEWETKSETTAVVRAVEDIVNGKIRVNVESVNPTKNHKLRVEELNADTTYLVELVSEGVRYGEDGEPMMIKTAATDE